MGRSYTPTYRIELVANVPMSMGAWNSKFNGRPTNANAERYRQSMNQSFQPNSGHPNAATGERVVPHIYKVVVVRQSTGKVVATALAPKFEVV